MGFTSGFKVLNYAFSYLNIIVPKLYRQGKWLRLVLVNILYTESVLQYILM